MLKEDQAVSQPVVCPRTPQSLPVRVQRSARSGGAATATALSGVLRWPRCSPVRVCCRAWPERLKLPPPCLGADSGTACGPGRATRGHWRRCLLLTGHAASTGGNSVPAVRIPAMLSAPVRSSPARQVSTEGDQPQYPGPGDPAARAPALTHWWPRMARGCRKPCDLMMGRDIGPGIKQPGGNREQAAAMQHRRRAASRMRQPAETTRSSRRP